MGSRVKRIGVGEFREHAEEYLAGDEVLTVECQGRPMGVYIPFQSATPDASQKALLRLEQAVAKARDVNHLTEDELADLLDLSKRVIGQGQR